MVSAAQLLGDTNVRFYNIILYQIALSCIVGAVVGYLGRRLLKFCRERQYVPPSQLT